jgi:hypothetical protein
VDLVVSIIFLRSPVLAILAMGRVVLLLGLSLHASAGADGFNGAAGVRLQAQNAPSDERGSLVPVYTIGRGGSRVSSGCLLRTRHRM